MIFSARLVHNGQEWETVRKIAEAPLYWVGEFGSVFRDRDGVLVKLKQQENPDGYLRVSLYRRGQKRITRYVHRLVLLAFVGPCPDGMEACHGIGGSKDNRVDNLRWDTPSANVSDRIRARYDREKYVPGAILYGSEWEIPD